MEQRCMCCLLQLKYLDNAHVLTDDGNKDNRNNDNNENLVNIDNGNYTDVEDDNNNNDDIEVKYDSDIEVGSNISWNDDDIKVDVVDDGKIDNDQGNIGGVDDNLNVWGHCHNNTTIMIPQLT